MKHLKFVDGSNDTIDILAIPYGGPLNGSDLQGERFTKSTDLCLDWFEERPLLYEHGLDETIKTSVVGRSRYDHEDEEGVWVKAQLDTSNKYFSAVKQLLDKGKLFASSGAMAHLVRKSAAGDIERWPWIELTLTPQPVNPFATVDWAAAKSHFKSLGLDDDGLDALKAKMDAAERNALPDSDFAYIDADGGRHLPINDEAHVRAAMARFNQTQIEPESARETAWRTIMTAAHRFGIEVSDDQMPGAGKSAAIAGLKSLEGSYEDLLEDLSALLNPQSPFGPSCYCCIIATYPDYVICHRSEYADSPTDLDDTYWKVAYSIGEDGEPVLGKAEQVEQTYVPTKSFSYDGPLALDAQSLTRHAQALAARTKDLHERRVQENRPLSAANQALLTTSVKALADSMTVLQSVLDATSAMVRDQAKAEALASPDALARQLEILSLFADTL